jgi:hypothetical protein
VFVLLLLLPGWYCAGCLNSRHRAGEGMQDVNALLKG